MESIIKNKGGYIMKFEPGITYASRSICDHNCIFEIKTISRTEKTLTYKYDNQIRRSSIHIDSQGNEFIRPDNYSMAPIFRATRPLERITAQSDITESKSRVPLYYKRYYRNYKHYTMKTIKAQTLYICLCFLFINSQFNVFLFSVIRNY